MYRIFVSLFVAVGFVVFSHSALAAPIAAGSFSTTWKTDNPGTTESNQIEFYLGSDGDTCAVSLYWEEVGNASNNGTVIVDENCNGTAPLTFPTPGTYRVDISGSFATLSLSTDEQKIVTIEQWGDNVWENTSRMFEDATNLVSNASDAPNLSAVTNMSFMFQNAANYNSDVSDWDVSNVTNMQGMFEGASAFNQSLGDWPVSDGVYLTDILNNSGINSLNYANTLIGWGARNLLVGGGDGGENMGSIPSTYCDTAQAARDILIANGWTITDLGPVACAVEEEEEEESTSSGSSGTRVGNRQSDLADTNTTTVNSLPEPDQSTLKKFFASVRQLIDYLRMNEEEIRNLTPEESQKLIVTLRDALLFILNLVPGV